MFYLRSDSMLIILTDGVLLSVQSIHSRSSITYALTAARLFGIVRDQTYLGAKAAFTVQYMQHCRPI